MTSLLILYIILFLLLIWFYSLYILILEGFRLKHSSMHTEGLEAISIIVPFFNEKDFLEKKVIDLTRVNLEGIKHEIIFVDGNSTDGSAELLESLINLRTNWKLLRSPRGGKINQLNYALKSLGPDSRIVVNTDVDTSLEFNSIRELLHVLAPEEVGVAGAFVSPENTVQLDKIFWDDQNFLRMRETAFHSTSSVIAPLYAFKREILSEFPENCIADDVYVSFRSNQLGKISVYCEKAKAIELRGSSSNIEFIWHKYRKGIANLRETFRFLKTIKSSHPRWKFIFLNRMCQLIFLPYVFFAFLALTGFLLLSGDQTVLGVVLACVVSGLILAEAAMKVKRRHTPDKSSTILSILNLTLSNMVLVVVVLCYPFVKHSSNYRKTL